MLTLISGSLSLKTTGTATCKDLSFKHEAKAEDTTVFMPEFLHQHLKKMYYN